MSHCICGKKYADKFKVFEEEFQGDSFPVDWRYLKSGTENCGT